MSFAGIYRLMTWISNIWLPCHRVKFSLQNYLDLNDELSCFLTPLLALFLICLYISSRALAMVFEHRNFVARYQRETNHITVARVAARVSMDADLQYWSKHSHRYISKTENDLWNLQFFDFFTWSVPLQDIGFKHIRFTSCFHRVFFDMFENKSRLTFVFCCFITVLLRSITAL